jgi:hypothetical protein
VGWDGSQLNATVMVGWSQNPTKLVIRMTLKLGTVPLFLLLGFWAFLSRKAGMIRILCLHEQTVIIQQRREKTYLPLINPAFIDHVIFRPAAKFLIFTISPAFIDFDIYPSSR